MQPPKFKMFFHSMNWTIKLILLLLSSWTNIVILPTQCPDQVELAPAANTSSPQRSEPSSLTRTSDWPLENPFGCTGRQQSWPVCQRACRQQWRWDQSEAGIPSPDRCNSTHTRGSLWRLWWLNTCGEKIGVGHGMWCFLSFLKPCAVWIKITLTTSQLHTYKNVSFQCQHILSFNILMLTHSVNRFFSNFKHHHFLRRVYCVFL